MKSADFKDEILRQILVLSDEDGVATSSDVVDAVLAAHDMDKDSLGEDTQGRPKAPILISQAVNKILRKEGLVESKGYGQWSLTPQGIQALQEEEDNTDTPEEGVSWSVSDTPPSSVVMTQIEDLGVSCFGYWSPRSDACKECLIVSECQYRLNERMLFASGVSTTEQRKNTSAPTLDQESLAGALEQATVRISTPPRGSVCAHCQESTDEGDILFVRVATENAILRSLGIPSGIYHETCLYEMVLETVSNR